MMYLNKINYDSHWNMEKQINPALLTCIFNYMIDVNESYNPPLKFFQSQCVKKCFWPFVEIPYLENDGNAIGYPCERPNV